MKLIILYNNKQVTLNATAQEVRDILKNRRSLLEVFDHCGGGINFPLKSVDGSRIFGHFAGRDARASGADPVFFTAETLCSLQCPELAVAILFTKHSDFIELRAGKFWEIYLHCLESHDKGEMSSEWLELSFAQLIFAAWLDQQGRQVDLADIGVAAQGNSQRN